MSVTFITGNQGKADFLAKFLGYPVKHQNVDVEEIQSLDLKEITAYKAKQAWAEVGSPILVEDAGLVINSFGRLPGPFIKWFHHELGLAKICQMAALYDDKSATAAVCFVYYDGHELTYFEGELPGSVSPEPRGSNGFGFDPIFIPQNSDITLAEMTDDELAKYSLRTTTVYPKIKQFLQSIDKK